MNVLYNSENYYVVEFPGLGGFLAGALELKFRATMADFAAGEPNAESVDEFLGHYDALLTNPMVLH